MKILRRVSLLLFICNLCINIFSPLVGRASSETQQWFGEANEAYSRHEFALAIDLYEQIIRERGFSTEILYNLANSYAQNGEVGKAVLNYERSLKIDPSNSDALGNLNLVRHQVGLFPPEPSLSERFFSLLSLNQWTGLGGLTLAVLTLLTAVLSVRCSITLRTQVVIGVVSLLLISTSVIGSIMQLPKWHASVVVTAGARLLVSPFATAAPTGDIKEGRLVYPHQQHGEYWYVSDETGRQGWIPNTTIEPVTTRYQ